MLKHITKSLVLLCTTSLIGCIGYDENKSSKPYVYSEGSCVSTKDDNNDTKCKVTIKFDKYTEGGLFLVLDTPSNSYESSCSGTLGCGIIKEGSFKKSFDECIKYFNYQSIYGSCDIDFKYTRGVSGQYDINVFGEESNNN